MNKTLLIFAFLSLIASVFAMASSPSPAPILSSPPLSIASPTVTLSPTSHPAGSPTASPVASGTTSNTAQSTTGSSYSSIHVAGPYIAMTFDDGPSPLTTPKLLDMLKERGIQATFFMIGKNAAAHPEIVQRIVAEGHEVANHSWSHPSLNKCSPEKFQYEVTATNDAIEKAGGVRPRLIRPPYGATNANLDRILKDQYGLKVVLWSVDPLDWKYRNSERVANYILSHTKAGDIILSHDIHATTVAAMPQVLDSLRAKGFKFVTVSELLAMQVPATPKASPLNSKALPINSHSPASASPSTTPSPTVSPLPSPFS